MAMGYSREFLRRSDQVLEYLRQHGPSTASQIRVALNLADRRHVSRALNALKVAGDVVDKTIKVVVRRRPHYEALWAVKTPNAEPLPTLRQRLPVGVTADDIAWMAEWRGHSARKRQQRHWA